MLIESVKITKDFYEIKISILLFQNGYYSPEEFKIISDKKSTIIKKEKKSIKLKENFFSTLKTFGDSIGKISDYIKSKSRTIKKAGEILLIASILTSTVQLSANETYDRYSSVFGTKTEKITDFQRNKFLNQIKEKTLKDFKTMTQAKKVNLYNLHIKWLDYGITNGKHINIDETTKQNVKNYLKKEGIKNINEIDYTKNITLLYINKMIVDLAIKYPEKYLKETTEIIENALLHELTHKYGDLKGQTNELAAIGNQKFYIGGTAKIIEELIQAKKIDLKKTNEKIAFKQSLEDIIHKTEKEKEMSIIILNNLDNIFDWNKKKISELIGTRQIKNEYIFEEYLEQIIGNDGYKKYTMFHVSISAGYIFNMNKCLLDNGYTKKEIEQYTKDILSKNYFIDKNLKLDKYKFNKEEIKEIKRQILEALLNKNYKLYQKKLINRKKENKKSRF